MCNQLPGRVHLGALHVRYRSESGLCDPSKTPWYEHFEDYKALTCRFGGAVLVRTQERVVALVVGRFRSVKKVFLPTSLRTFWRDTPGELFN